MRYTNSCRTCYLPVLFRLECCGTFSYERVCSVSYFYFCCVPGIIFGRSYCVFRFLKSVSKQPSRYRRMILAPNVVREFISTSKKGTAFHTRHFATRVLVLRAAPLLSPASRSLRCLSANYHHSGNRGGSYRKRPLSRARVPGLRCPPASAIIYRGGFNVVVPNCGRIYAKERDVGGVMLRFVVVAISVTQPLPFDIFRGPQTSRSFLRRPAFDNGTVARSAPFMCGGGPPIVPLE